MLPEILFYVMSLNETFDVDKDYAIIKNSKHVILSLNLAYVPIINLTV